MHVEILGEEYTDVCNLLSCIKIWWIDNGLIMDKGMENEYMWLSIVNNYRIYVEDI